MTKKPLFYLLACLLLLLPILLLATKTFIKQPSLKNILQTIPVIQSNPSFACKFNKAAYSPEPVEEIKLESVKVVNSNEGRKQNEK